MLIGYARTSTAEQLAGLADQVRELTAASCDLIYQEHVSALADDRPELDRALAQLSAGDMFIVTKLDRLARSLPDFWRLAGQVKSTGAELRIINLGLDTSTATGRLMLNLVGAIAQFEREMMLERQKAGIALARSEGKYKGRKPKAAPLAPRINAMIADGLTRAEVAQQLNLSTRSVYRVLATSAISMMLLLSSPAHSSNGGAKSFGPDGYNVGPPISAADNVVDPWTLEVLHADGSVEMIAAQNKTLCDTAAGALDRGFIQIRGARSWHCVHVNSFAPGWNRGQ